MRQPGTKILKLSQTWLNLEYPSVPLAHCYTYHAVRTLPYPTDVGPSCVWCGTPE